MIAFPEYVPFDEYRKHLGIASSDLSVLQYGPQWFYDCKYNGIRRGFESKSFLLGSLVDTKLLEPDRFDEQFVLLPPDIQRPSSPQMERFCEYLRAGVDYRSAYEASYSTKGKNSDQIVKEATKMGESFSRWVDFEAYAQGKQIYTVDDAEKMLQCYQSVDSHARARSLLLTVGDGTERFQAASQVTLFFPWLGVDCKARLDRVVLDYENKIIYNVDLKTTGRPVYGFWDSYQKFHYYRQQALYSLALQYFLQRQMDLKGWGVINTIVAVETSDYFQTRVYIIPNELIQKGIEEAKSLLERFKWHSDNRIWDQTREYYTQDGVEVLEEPWPVPEMLE